MKVLLLVGIIVLIQQIGISQNNKTTEYINLFQNQPIGSTVTDQYLIYRTENMFEIKEINDPKVDQYQVLTNIEYKLKTDDEYITISITEFIQKFNDGEINPLLLNIKRDRNINIWYKLGNSNKVLIGKSETQLLNEFNQTIKK